MPKTPDDLVVAYVNAVAKAQKQLLGVCLDYATQATFNCCVDEKGTAIYGGGPTALASHTLKMQDAAKNLLLEMSRVPLNLTLSYTDLSLGPVELEDSDA